MTKKEINGTTLEVIEQGSGETVVFVHGSLSDHRTWAQQRDVFAQSFHTVTYSRRYHWPNDPIPDGADYAMSEHVDDLEALIRSLGTAPVHLVGNSYGAFISLLLATRAPDLLRSLVLAEPPVVTLFVSTPPKPQQLLKLLVTRPRTAVAIIKLAAFGLNPAAQAVKRGDRAAAAEIFTKAALGSEAFQNMAEERKEQGRANFIDAELLGSGFPPLEDEQVRRVNVPTLLGNGTRSPRVFHYLTDRLHDLLPRSQHVEISAASHLVHEDNPQAYNAAVLAFLKEHARKLQPA